MASTASPGTSTAARPKIVVARNLGPDVVHILDRPDLEVVAWPSQTKPCDRKWLLENIVGATGVLVMLSEKVDAEFIEAAGPALRVVSTFSVGYEHVDHKQLSQRGIKLGFTPDVLTDAVADLSIMLALMAGRNVGETTALVRAGEESRLWTSPAHHSDLCLQWPKNSWSPFAFCGPQLSASAIHPTRTAGFLGFGRIAQATLARLIPFGITHCIYSGNPSSPENTALNAALVDKHGLQSVRRVGLEELARESDVLFVLAPGSPQLRHVVDESFLKNMKETGVLVNTSRGTLVDSDALAKALKERWLWGAGLDVVEGEPNVSADHPLVNEPRCIVLPHIGSATTETRLGMATTAVKNLIAGVFDEPMPAQVKM
ncbi:hypothetical protein B0H21DRAFT_288589 [Amylocystis lapponica]|nr:hypothetical protein B0H21DRAFT_288589 [Amylocystis lapponica]